MNARIAQCCALLALITALPATAHAAPITPLATPCALAERLRGMHGEIRRITQEAYDISNTVERLDHTSRWRPYRRIEVEWSDLHARVLSALTELSDFPLDLDALPDRQGKKTAEELISTDQNALERIIDYTSVAVYVEHTENDLSRNSQPQVLNFGVSKSEIPSTYDSIARNHFLAQFLTVDDAVHLLTIPERHYATFCHIAPWN